MAPRTQHILLIAGVVVLVLVLIALGILPGRKAPGPSSTVIEFWGFGDDDEVWTSVINAFKKQYAYIGVVYKRFDEATYEDTLINRIAAGKGPDIFMLKNSQLAKHRDKIAPISQRVFKFTARDMNTLFVDGATMALTEKDGTIVGVPLFVDTPALFYNKDIFNAEGIASPPGASWEDVTALAGRLTQKTVFNELIRSGMALGTFDNIDNAFEIVSSLFLQTGGKVIDRKSSAVDFPPSFVEALDLYTSFADPSKTQFSWTKDFPGALDAFAEGKTAMAIGFASDIGRLKGKNAHLNFGIVPLPQQKKFSVATVYGSYFFPTVSKFSKHADAAWTFILYAASRDVAREYLDVTNRPPARRDLITAGSKSPELDVFYRQALIAKDWAVPDDRGARRAFRDVITAVAAGTEKSSQAHARLRSQIELLMAR